MILITDSIPNSTTGVQEGQDLAHSTDAAPFTADTPPLHVPVGSEPDMCSSNCFLMLLNLTNKRKSYSHLFSSVETSRGGTQMFFQIIKPKTRVVAQPAKAPPTISILRELLVQVPAALC